VIRSRTILLTGASGFLGKVILEELVRRRAELHVDRIVAVIRPKGKKSGAERFETDVVKAPCFSHFPPGWQRIVTVLEGDLVTPGFGRDDASQAVLSKVTHIMHSAASVSFDLPVQQATLANITATLQLVELAKSIPSLERFTYVSTAYVTPNNGNIGPITEKLASLPMDASALLERIETDPDGVERTMLAAGYPNTYTFTKSVCEHLLLERCGTIPVSIVRPSIITAARQNPFPGWIDSTAGFGAFVALIGLGAMRVVEGDPNAQLDIVAVDDVAHRVVEESFAGSPHATIRHATAGLERAAHVGDSFKSIRKYFREHPVAGRPKSGYVGLPGFALTLHGKLKHDLPLKLAEWFAPEPRRRQAERAKSKRDNLNEIFPYFTTRNFDFRSTTQMEVQRDPAAFVRTICHGIAVHVLGRDDHEWVLAGRRQTKNEGTLWWTVTQPRGNFWVRLGVWLSMKLLRRITERVTVDLTSFERARNQVRPQDAIVLLPTHRSYLDFILVSTLAFARPDLRIGIPHVAAAIEFGKLPIIGWLLRSVHAFYVRRGAGKENRELTQRVHKLLGEGEVLEFFIEGERSRSRAFLPPKRGLLRAVATCGRPSTAFPISISYDRIPEEAAFLSELRGGARPKMHLKALLKWLGRAWRGEVQLGRIHIACGAPIAIDPGASVERLANAVIEQQKLAMGVTSFHLEVLAAAGTPLNVRAGIERALHARGQMVHQSGLPVPEPLDPTFVETIEAHCAAWMPPGEPVADDDLQQRAG
jgi:fatty acyl-CoA reductase